MKIIILGSEGQLGFEFVKFLEDKEEIYYFNHKKLDITDFNILEKFF